MLRYSSTGNCTERCVRHPSAFLMASSLGVFGGRGRCHQFWTDFAECMGKAGVPSECSLKREDYFECLHHRKEFARMNTIALQKVAREKAARENAK